MSPLVMAILLVVVTAGLVGLRYGARPERIAAAAIMTWILADGAYHSLFGPSGFDNVDPVHVVLDGGELVVIVWLALNANRLWPLWAAAAQVICVTGHFAVLVEPHGMRRAYWALTQLPQYIQITALLIGTACHARRSRRIGQYRSWRLT